MRLNPFKKKKKDKEIEQAEKDFNEGKIILPTGIVDYNDFEEFKRKTSHIPHIQEELNIIKNNKVQHCK